MRQWASVACSEVSRAGFAGQSRAIEATERGTSQQDAAAINAMRYRVVEHPGEEGEVVTRMVCRLTDLDRIATRFDEHS